MPQKEYLNRREAAEYLRARGIPCSPATLAKLACVGGGPQLCRFGNARVLYRPGDLDGWANARLTTQSGAAA
jgi:hypothetical protein